MAGTPTDRPAVARVGRDGPDDEPTRDVIVVVVGIWLLAVLGAVGEVLGLPWLTLGAVAVAGLATTVLGVTRRALLKWAVGVLAVTSAVIIGMFGVIEKFDGGETGGDGAEVADDDGEGSTERHPTGDATDEGDDGGSGGSTADTDEGSTDRDAADDAGDPAGSGGGGAGVTPTPPVPDGCFEIGADADAEAKQRMRSAWEEARGDGLLLGDCADEPSTTIEEVGTAQFISGHLLVDEAGATTLYPPADTEPYRGALAACAATRPDTGASCLAADIIRRIGILTERSTCQDGSTALTLAGGSEYGLPWSVWYLSGLYQWSRVTDDVLTYLFGDGGPASSPLGYPTSHARTAADGMVTQSFEGGSIQVTAEGDITVTLSRPGGDQVSRPQAVPSDGTLETRLPCGV